jgi:hypothetical protein
MHGSFGHVVCSWFVCADCFLLKPRSKKVKMHYGEPVGETHAAPTTNMCMSSIHLPLSTYAKKLTYNRGHRKQRDPLEARFFSSKHHSREPLNNTGPSKQLSSTPT